MTLDPDPLRPAEEPLLDHEWLFRHTLNGGTLRPPTPYRESDPPRRIPVLVYVLAALAALGLALLVGVWRL